MLIYNAHVYTMSEGIIHNGWLSFENGKITGVGDADSQPAAASTDINAEGAIVTPGIIDAHCHLGLFEDSQRSDDTDDCNEWSAPVTPQMRVIDAINPLDVTFEQARRGGITTVCALPGSANPIGGQAAIIKTRGNRVDNMVVRAPAALKIAFGENPRLHGKCQKDAPYTRMGTAALIREAFLIAKNYVRKDKPDVKSEVLQEVLAGKIPVHAHAHRACDMLTARRIADEFGFELVFVHATEGDLIAEHLTRESVITGPTLGTREKPELRNLSFKTPAALSNAGLKIAICTDAPVLPIDSLPLMAGLAARAGMDSYEALRAITLYPAAILKLADRLGAIKPGLDADIVLWQGLPTNTDGKPRRVWINGEPV
ncbi:amidohydrolase [Clostridia bacterium]|nr:amidohydrolase [Clostridia bacterium]